MTEQLSLSLWYTEGSWELKIIFLKTQTMISSADTKCIIPIGQTQHLTMRDSGMKKAESLP